MIPALIWVLSSEAALPFLRLLRLCFAFNTLLLTENFWSRQPLILKAFSGGLTMTRITYLYDSITYFCSIYKLF